MSRLTIGLMSTAALAGLTAGIVSAADVTPAPRDWTGIYLGLHAGYATGFDSSLKASSEDGSSGRGPDSSFLAGLNDGSSGDGPDGSFLAGFHVGANYQHGAIVFGGELGFTAFNDASDDLSASGVVIGPTDYGQGLLPKPMNDVVGIATNAEGEFGIGNVITLRGRLGYDIDGTWLPFITGGLALGQILGEGTATYDVYDSGGAPIGSVSHNFGDNEYELGWVLGAGLNYRLSDNAFLGLTYLYTDLGEHSFKDKYVDESGVVGSVEGEVDARFHSVLFSFDVMF